jgi:hypothetical protein
MPKPKRPRDVNQLAKFIVDGLAQHAWSIEELVRLLA